MVAKKTSTNSFCIEAPKRIKGSCEHRLGGYGQEAEQIRPGHKLLNGKLVRSLDLNSPITEEKIGKKYPSTRLFVVPDSSIGDHVTHSLSLTD